MTAPAFHEVCPVCGTLVGTFTRRSANPDVMEWVIKTHPRTPQATLDQICSGSWQVIA